MCKIKRTKKSKKIKEYYSNHYVCPKCFHSAQYIDMSACEPDEIILRGEDDAFCHYLIDEDTDQRCDWKGKIKDCLPKDKLATPTEKELERMEYYKKHLLSKMSYTMFDNAFVVSDKIKK